jgi:hypothetical protein
LSLCLIKHYALRHSSSILDLGTTWGSVVGFTPQPLYLRGKSPQYPLDRRLDGPRAGLDTVGKRKIRAPDGNRTPTFSPYTVAIPTELSWRMLNNGSPKKEKKRNETSCPISSPVRVVGSCVDVGTASENRRHDTAHRILVRGTLSSAGYHLHSTSPTPPRNCCVMSRWKACPSRFHCSTMASHPRLCAKSAATSDSPSKGSAIDSRHQLL